jgi:hypothetical protein
MTWQVGSHRLGCPSRVPVSAARLGCPSRLPPLASPSLASPSLSYLLLNGSTVDHRDNVGMGQPKLERFLPSRDAFGFANSWPDEPAVSIPTPLRRVGIGNAARGLCGGMVFGALDYWHAGAQPPVNLPAPGEPLFRFIVRRLIRSWHIPAGVARYYYWMLLPDGDAVRHLAGPIVLRRRGLRTRSIAGHWPRIRTQLDAGHPAALGIVTVAGASPFQLGHNHQVLAYDYRLDGTQTTLQVYDPNSGPVDDVFIRFDAAAPASGFTHSVNIGQPVRGFFLTSYSAAAPPRTVSPPR